MDCKLDEAVQAQIGVTEGMMSPNEVQTDVVEGELEETTCRWKLVAQASELVHVRLIAVELERP